MGFKENLITNWEDKTLEYKGKTFYIIKQFEYEGKTYMCGANVETIYNEETELVFLYKIKYNVFGYVDKQEDFENIIMVVSGLLVGETIQEAAKKYGNKPN